MTTDRAELLWRRAVAALAARGQLPPAAGTMTPAEIARALRTAGDDRLRCFVDGYYYPERYGQTTGSLTADQAERIVAAIEGERSPSVAGSRPARGQSGAPLCAICGERPRRRGRTEPV
jgi:hypothetical protein